MSRIQLGLAGQKPVYIEPLILLRTRALITANSGGGKSWLLRLLAEQLFGKVPIWIIDPEGEFKTLREKFGYVLVGKGGETPADPRTAPLVATKLRELGCSVVFDLYDLKPAERHRFVRALFEALMNMPKNLWRPLILKLDEAQMFCPERGFGESEALDAVVDVATRGRKRGISLIAYTQRLAKISKTVTAELLNRLVGMTREGIDIDRAVEVLSVARAERDQFRIEVKQRQAGEFYAMGPAISNDRILLTVGNVQTTHPEVGQEWTDITPPAPEKIRALLPKLADLPKEAEAKLQTESELRARIRTLEVENRKLSSSDNTVTSRPAPTPAPKPKAVEIPIIREGRLKRIEAIVEKLHESAGNLISVVTELKPALLGAIDESRAGAKRVQPSALAPEPLNPLVRHFPAIMKHFPVPVKHIEPKVERSDVTVSRPQLKILGALAMFEALGISDVPRTWIAPLADTTHSSSGFEKNVSTLKTAGYLEVGSPGNIRIRAEGRGEVGDQPAPTTEQLLHKCFGAISNPQAQILRTLAEVFPADLSREEIAEKCSTTTTSSGFEKNMSTLRTAGMIEIPGKGRARASSWIFPDQVRP